MTKLRRKPTGYLTFLVEPANNFRPLNWQQSPESYRIVEYAGPMAMLGEADSWKFLHNQAALRNRNHSLWAIHISMATPSAFSELQKLTPTPANRIADYVVNRRPLQKAESR